MYKMWEERSDRGQERSPGTGVIDDWQELRVELKKKSNLEEEKFKEEAMDEKLMRVEQIIKGIIEETKRYNEDAEKQQRIIDELEKKAKAEGRNPWREGCSEDIGAMNYRHAIIARNLDWENRDRTEATGFEQIAKLFGY